MAAAQRTTSTTTTDERAAVEPFAQQLLKFARSTDPAATYTLAPPIDPGMWIMHLHVRGELVDDPDFTEALAERTTDMLIEHDVGIATLLHARLATMMSPAREAAASVTQV